MKHALALLAPLVTLGVLAGSFWYVGARLHALFGVATRRLLAFAIAGGVVASGVAMLGAARPASPAVGVLNVLGGFVCVSYPFLLLALLGLQVIQLGWRPPPVWSGVAALALALVATAAGGLWANSFTVNETVVELPRLERAVSVMQISDVQLGHHRGRAYLARIVEETNRRRPDLPLITRDLIGSMAALEPGLLEPLSRLAAPAFFVGGNHEKCVDPRRAFELIARQGVRVLHNEVVETQGLQLAGLDHMNPDEDTSDMHPSDDQRTIRSVPAALSVTSDSPSVLMHHSPGGARYVAAKGVGLMLSGHTHAGQGFPITWIAGLVFPFNRGLHREGDSSIFVSQGAGTFVTRVRLGTSNELNFIRLQPGGRA